MLEFASTSINDEFGEVPLPDRFGTTQHLYVGSLAAAEHLSFINSKKITHVLTAAGRLQVQLPSPKPFHMSIDLADHPSASLFEFIDDALSFCDLALGSGHCQSESALLVHCASGVSRSVSVCLAFLMTRAGLTYEEALEAVRRNRPVANPNLGFQHQLRFIEKHHGDVSRAAELWQKDNGEDILQSARVQREAANDLHAELDSLENAIAAKCSAASGGKSVDRQRKRREWLAPLEDLQDRIDSCHGSSGDRVAKSILKAASQKTARLIKHTLTTDAREVDDGADRKSVV